jgi:hypothetical protein
MAIKIKKESSKLWETNKSISEVIDLLGIEYPILSDIQLTNSPMDILLYDGIDISESTKILKKNPNELIPSDWNNLEPVDGRDVESEIRSLKKGKLPIICYISKNNDIFVIEGIRRVYAAIHKKIEVTVICIPEIMYNKYKFTDIEWKWVILDSHSDIKITQ